MKHWGKRSILLGFLAMSLFASAQSQAPALDKVEESVAKQFNHIRQQSGLPPLRFRRDLRLRMEACSVETRGPDPKVENPQTKYKIWYLTADPDEPTEDLARLARQRTDRDHVAVGIWFATTAAYPSGAYWIVVYPEHGAAHEAFWSHFYLSDDFEYQTIFDKSWMKRLPDRCRNLK